MSKKENTAKKEYGEKNIITIKPTTPEILFRAFVMEYIFNTSTQKAEESRP